MGTADLLNLLLQANRPMTVSGGHQIGKSVTGEFLDTFSGITNPTIHFDAEDAAEIEEHEPSITLLGHRVGRQLSNV